jgi:hypothetical protein
MEELLLNLSEYIHSEEFAARARHPKFPKAFTRNRKLPLPALIGVLLSMRGASQQVMLDTFFGNLCGEGSLHEEVSDRGFAKARARLHLPALEELNQRLVALAEAAGMIPRWHGLRVVAADASVLMPAVRACHRTRSPAPPEQRLFALSLPGPELTLHASVHSAEVGERAMLVEALDQLGPDDVLVLDRGYPAAWLVALLNAMGIRFCIRCDSSSGWSGLRQFQQSGADEAMVTLSTPSAQEVQDWQCPAQAPTVRLIRQVAPNGKIRVLATNLDTQARPRHLFSELYHLRWRLEEAFKRFKHRLLLECVSGLSQHALIIDVAAKILADNLAALLCAHALASEYAPGRNASDPRPPLDAATIHRQCNRSYAAAFLQHALPRLLLMIGDFCATLRDTLRHLARNTQRFIPGRSRPRPAHHVKLHPSLVYKH